MVSNADMGSAEIREYCVLDGAGKGLLRAGMQELLLNATVGSREHRPDSP